MKFINVANDRSLTTDLWPFRQFDSPNSYKSFKWKKLQYTPPFSNSKTLQGTEKFCVNNLESIAVYNLDRDLSLNIVRIIRSRIWLIILLSAVPIITIFLYSESKGQWKNELETMILLYIHYIHIRQQHRESATSI